MEKIQQKFVITFSSYEHIALPIIGHTEKWYIFWEFGTILGCFFPIAGNKSRRHSRPGKPLTDWAEPFRLFIQNYSFAGACMLSRHFSVCAITAKEIFVRDLGLKKFTQRWVPHTLSDPQQVTRVETSNELLQILNDLEADSFDGITTGNESWFHYLYESSVCLRSRQVMPFQECEKKLVQRKLCLLLPLPIGSC
jgi:hypothetical protein